MTYGWSKGETVKNVGGFMTNLIDTIVYAGRLKNKSNLMNSLIILGISEPPVRTLRATIPENESHIFR